ncbi:gastrin-releasing peptide [Dendropsophus ebraccatus]|uniref:gastrin-releasing peptide n=1 Tax=Dendropsophus ebraccatus TaxID=150705 RepID=UPI0038315F46
MEGALIFWRYRTLFSLILCTLILFKVHSQAAPSQQQQHQDTAPLSKVYTRGSHWAVGHLMGKKSIEEYPYMYDGGDRTSAAGYMDGDKSVEGSQQWREALLSLLRMLETSDVRNSQSMRDTRLFNRKFLDSDDNNNYKEVLDYLYQMMKENAQS